MSAEFRITGTGTVVQMDKTPEIVKKLKLVGYPMKVRVFCVLERAWRWWFGIWPPSLTDSHLIGARFPLDLHNTGCQEHRVCQGHVQLCT